MMKWNDPEYLEAIRLVRKFFPESKAITSYGGLHWDEFIGVMRRADFHEDSSCDPYCLSPTNPEITLASKGGFNESGSKMIYECLLAHTGYNPQGRVVVIPDSLGTGSWSKENRLPFVCHSRTLPERLEEFDALPGTRYIFDGASDAILVFESGEALVVNHDYRFYWAKSKIRTLS